MNRQQINKMQSLLRAFQKFDASMPIPVALTMLEVAKGDGVTGRDLEARLDMSNATVSRNLLKMHDLRPDGNRGWDLLVNKEDPSDRRGTMRYPNDNLKKFIMQLEAIMEE